MDYVFDLNTLESTGIIECPYCDRSKAYVYNNATGKLSSACNICGRIVLWDFDIVNIGLHFFHKDVRLYAASCSEV